MKELIDKLGTAFDSLKADKTTLIRDRICSKKRKIYRHTIIFYPVY